MDLHVSFGRLCLGHGVPQGWWLPGPELADVRNGRCEWRWLGLQWLWRWRAGYLNSASRDCSSFTMSGISFINYVVKVINIMNEANRDPKVPIVFIFL